MCFLLIISTRKSQKKANPKKVKSFGGIATPKPPSEAAMVFKTFDKSSGANLRSSKTKFPLTLGQKKTKTIEQVLEELGVGKSYYIYCIITIIILYIILLYSLE